MQFHGFPVTLYLTFPPSLLLLRCNSITGLPVFSKQKKGRTCAPDPPQHLLLSLFPTPTPQRRPRGGANSSATPHPWLYLASTCPIHVTGPKYAHYVHNTCHSTSYLLSCGLFLYTLQANISNELSKLLISLSLHGAYLACQLTHSSINPYPTAFPYGNGMVLHFYQQQESSTTKTVHKVINKGLKTYV